MSLFISRIVNAKGKVGQGYMSKYVLILFTMYYCHGFQLTCFRYEFLPFFSHSTSVLSSAKAVLTLTNCTTHDIGVGHKSNQRNWDRLDRISVVQEYAVENVIEHWHWPQFGQLLKSCICNQFTDNYIIFSKNYIITAFTTFWKIQSVTQYYLVKYIYKRLAMSKPNKIYTLKFTSTTDNFQCCIRIV